MLFYYLLFFFTLLERNLHNSIQKPSILKGPVVLLTIILASPLFKPAQNQKARTKKLLYIYFVLLERQVHPRASLGTQFGHYVLHGYISHRPDILVSIQK